MSNFAEYILNEKDLDKKIEIMIYANKKAPIYFDKTIIFKTLVAKVFIETMKIDVDENLVLTACLLCGCKKGNDPLSLDRVQTYAKDSADYLRKLGFSERFCKICLEQNRYNDSLKREKESDIIELVDQFGGMMIDRAERRGFPIDEAIILLEQRNLKGYDNYYLNQFVDFINKEMEIIV